MGISKVIGSAGTALFLASMCLMRSGWTLTSIALLDFSLIACLVSVLSHPAIDYPLILGKRSDGSFPLWSKVIFGPFLVFVRLYVLFKKLKRKEPVYTEVSEGLYVGGWPSMSNHLPHGGPAVVDCTCELPRSSFVPRDSYLCIPLWDTRSPSPSQIHYAVQWASKKRAEKKPVYIHCGFGHGRSVCIMCALLVTLGVTENWKDAEKMIKEKRPKIRMNVNHRKNLEEWTKQQRIPKAG